MTGNDDIRIAAVAPGRGQAAVDGTDHQVLLGVGTVSGTLPLALQRSVPMRVGEIQSVLTTNP